MSLKRNSLEGLKALIDIASGTETGGATDDLGEGQVYVAKIVKQIQPEREFTVKYSDDDAPRTSRLYKIRLEEELGNSVTGGELLPDDLEGFLDVLPSDRSEGMVNFIYNMLPEGIFIATDTPEFPDVGDEVYATTDGGIENRYLLSLKNGMAKGILGGYVENVDFLNDAVLTSSAFGSFGNGTPISDLVTKNQDWRGNPQKWSQEKKLASLDPVLAEKVATILVNLSQRGFQPTIFYGWRDTKTQERLLAAGSSTVSFSFHNATQDGQPNSYAADIIDKRYWWENGTEAERNAFWKALGEEAKKLDLIWGGDWRFKDWAHVQLLKNSELATVKANSDTNLSYT